MKKATVGIVGLGEKLPIDIEKLVALLNRRQKSYEFDFAGVITADVVGDPDIRNNWYDIPRLTKLVTARTAAHYDYVVGVTKTPITHSEDFPSASSGDIPFPPPKLDYFSRSDYRRVAIITVQKSLLDAHTGGKPLLQVAAFLTVTEVLIMTAKENLTHYGDPDCAFNDCEDRDLLRGCIESGMICSARCMGKLKSANVPDSTIESVKHVLRWCSRPTWGHAVKCTFQNAYVGLAIGTGIGWLSALYIGKDQYMLMIGVTLIPISVVLFLAKKNNA